METIGKIKRTTYLENEYGVIYKQTSNQPQKMISLHESRFIIAIAEQQGHYTLSSLDVVKCFKQCGTDYYKIKEYFKS